MENQEEGRNSDNNSSEDHRQNNYVTAAQLKKEIQKIMDSMSRSQMRQDVSDTDVSPHHIFKIPFHIQSSHSIVAGLEEFKVSRVYKVVN